MAIEVDVRKEIKEYEEKLFFGLSLKQFVCTVIAIVSSVLIGFLNYKFLHYSIDNIGLFIMLLNVPIFGIGWYKKDGRSLIKHVKVVRRYKNQAPFYPFITRRREVKTIEIEDRKEKKRRKEYEH